MRAHNLLHPGRARRFAVPGMLVAAVAAAFAAPSTASAAQQVRAELRNGTLVVTGSDNPESIALRLRAGRPDKLQIVVNNNVRAMIKLDIVNRILVEGGRGSDTLRIDETNGAFTQDKPTALNGQAGQDTLIGGSGAETFRGGNGNDFADGNRGDDEALLGAGNDVFRWDPGDGNDRIQGGASRDAMLFIGSGANERIDISANGERVRFFRDVANVTMDLDATEEIEFEALGGADNVVVNDLSGTDVVNVITDLEGVLGSNAGDGQPDTIVARGTNGDDAVQVVDSGGLMRLTGLATEINALNGELANDAISFDGNAGSDRATASGTAAGELFDILPSATAGHVKASWSTASLGLDLVASEDLTIDARGGDDTIAGADGLATLIALTLVGGTGVDTINGGDGADTILGGSQNDFVDGNRGDDTALLGDGDDTFRWDPGDGSDVIEGQANTDTMLFNGAGASENVDVSANGARVRFFRNIANVTMDLNDTEKIFFQALGGADNVVVNDLSGTDMREVKTDLAAVVGGTAGDAQPDTVTVKGTSGEDRIVTRGENGTASTLGLTASVLVAGAEPANDLLIVRALAGDDRVDASDLAASAIGYAAEGGDNDDTLIGGSGDDRLDGGQDDDFLNGGIGADEITCGGGGDIIVRDGADIVAPDC